METILAVLLGFILGAPVGWVAHDAVTPDATDPARAELEFCRNDRMILPTPEEAEVIPIRLARVIEAHDGRYEAHCQP